MLLSEGFVNLSVNMSRDPGGSTSSLSSLNKSMTKVQDRGNAAFSSTAIISRSVPVRDCRSGPINTSKYNRISRRCGTSGSWFPQIKLFSSSRTIKYHSSPASHFACKSPGRVFKKNEARLNELGVKSTCLKKCKKEIHSGSDLCVSPLKKFRRFKNDTVSKPLTLQKHQGKQCCDAQDYVSCDTPDRNNIHHLINGGTKKIILGKGAYGTVVRGKYKGEEIAVKIISEAGYSSLKKESNAVHLTHPNIINILRIVQNEEYGMVLMERNFGPNLQEVLCFANTSLKPLDRVWYMLNVSEALEYCHSQGILHLDVKPKNILLCTLTNTCKLCDFGSSVTIEELQIRPIKGNFWMNTIRYTDPQLFLGKLPSVKSDIYSLGVTMWQMISRKMPYDGENYHLIIYKVVSRGCRPEEVLDEVDEDEDYQNLYKLCWRADPEERPDSSFVSAKLREFLQLLNH